MRRGPKQVERLALVRTYAEMGLPVEVISKATGISSATVRNDLRRLPKGTWTPSTSFAQLYKHYLESLYSRPRNSELAEALYTYLKLDQFEAAVQLVAKTLLRLKRPRGTAVQQPYITLVGHISGTFVDNGLRQNCVVAYQRDVLNGARTFPKDLRSAIDAVCAAMAEDIREDVAPVWPSDAVTIVDSVLETVMPKPRHALIEFYGLQGTSQKNADEIALQCGVTKETVKSQLHFALRQLRHPIRLRRMWKLVRQHAPEAPVFITREELTQRQRAALEEAGLKGISRPDFLIRSVEELEVSVRTANCLRASEIRTIGELVQKTPADLLRYRHFGRKSLMELSDLLKEMDLDFGLKLPENWEDIIRNA